MVTHILLYTKSECNLRQCIDMIKKEQIEICGRNTMLTEFAVNEAGELLFCCNEYCT